MEYRFHMYLTLNITNRMKTELLRQLEASDHEKVFVLASTNCPWDLDAAFLRRFQQRVFIPLPNRLVHFNILFTIFLI